MTSTGHSTAQVTLSGRELALQRRQAMALRGKASGVGKSSGVVQTAGAPAARPAMALAAPKAPGLRSMEDSSPSMPPAPRGNAARLRRQALSQAGKAATAAPSADQRPAAASQPVASCPPNSALEDCGCGCNGAQACAIAEPSAQSTMSRLESATPLDAGSLLQDTGSTRALAKARRVALASGGKKGALRVAQATRLAAVLPQQDWQQAIEKGASAREIAKQRRLVCALIGRQESASGAPRSNGRMRAKNTTAVVPSKVALGHTLSGQSVTGTSVDSSRKVTGSEAGACKSVTGTEYLSLEQFSVVCGTKPAPGPSKVAVSSTLRDQKVTGTELGRAGRVTGQPVGAGSAVTGAERLSPRSPQSGKASAPAPSPRQVSVMRQPGAQAASGAAAGRAVTVTGNESGASRPLTGSQYFSAHDFGLQTSRELPSKVAFVQTLAGSTVTGTEVGHSAKVTGDDRGACRAVTGTEYLSTQQLGAVCATAEPVQPVSKVGRDRTWNHQTITGARLGRAPGVTGNEHGVCAPISGTSYAGRQQYEAFCQPAQTEAQQALSRVQGVVSASYVTGDRPGAGGAATTGDQRGACEFISGTPYIGADNQASQCGVSARFVAPVRPEKPAVAGVVAQDFSIRSPSRQARDRSTQEVTGSAFSGQRITGAANKGAGLITGTPEFRHRDAAMPAAPQAQSERTSAASKLTGEGSQTGARISGSAWDTSTRVTGTEGTSSLARNPSQRGAGRAMGMQAIQFRKEERTDQPESRVTGSSGQAAKGAAVTLSGGARG